MKTRLSHSHDGIALIIVMVVITVLAILAGGFAYSMKVETTLARRAAFSSDLDWAGRSGVEVAKWVLSQSAQGPEGPVDSLKQKWAGGPGATNDALAGIDLKNYPFGNWTLAIDIKDLDRKFNINAANEIILNQALTLIGADAAVSSTIANSILDWVDGAEAPDPRMGGAETDYYSRLELPYFAKDGPIDDLSELLWVKGVSEDPNIYWGSQSGTGVARPRTRHASDSVFDQPVYAVGLVDLFTPLSSGKVNINTASATVLQVIPEIDANIAQAIIAVRAGLDGQDGTEDDMPFRSVQEIARVPGLPPEAAALLARYFFTRSMAFEVTVTVNIGGLKRECVAILRRSGQKDFQTVNMYWKS